MLMMASAAIASQGAEKKAPQFLSNYVLQAVSPNGQWTVSELYGNVTLINIETGAETTFKADETGTKNYTVGTGNALSNDGLLICSSGSTSYGEYYEDGEWKQLKVGTAKNSNSFPNGVTPDGKRICGNIGLHETSFDDVTMCVPAIWDRQADGTFGDYVLLPHPNDDYFGRAPQYIKAIAISDDGHTVVGQITDCRGFLAYPIVYTENAKGEWSYSLPTAGTFNPNNVAIPEYPGESPNPPQAENYMTADQIAAYNEARNAWAASGYQQDLYPEYVDYMSADKRAQYEADEAKYQADMADWSPKWDAYDQAYWEICSTSSNFETNQVALNPDGKFIAVTHTFDEQDPMSWFPKTVNNVWVYSLIDNSVTKYDSPNMSVKSCAGDYITAVEVDQESGCYNGFLLKDGTVTSLYDYLCAQGDDIKEWVDLNMTHQTEYFDYETESVVTKEVSYTGLPSASRDLSVIVSWTQSVWGDYSPESYLFQLEGLNSITTPATSARPMAFDANGNLHVGNDAAEVAVYDLAGVCRVRGAVNGASVPCDLAPGVYIVKVTYTDGSVATGKTVR